MVLSLKLTLDSLLQQPIQHTEELQPINVMLDLGLLLEHRLKRLDVQRKESGRNCPLVLPLLVLLSMKFLIQNLSFCLESEDPLEPLFALNVIQDFIESEFLSFIVTLTGSGLLLLQFVKRSSVQSFPRFPTDLLLTPKRSTSSMTKPEFNAIEDSNWKERVQILDADPIKLLKKFQSVKILTNVPHQQPPLHLQFVMLLRLNATIQRDPFGVNAKKDLNLILNVNQPLIWVSQLELSLTLLSKQVAQNQDTIRILFD